MRLTGEVERVTGLQKDNANTAAAITAAGIIIAWPLLIALAATKDRQGELSGLRGEYDAVDLSIRTRHCTPPVPGMPSVPAVRTPEIEARVAGVQGTYQGKGSADSWCQTPSLALTIRGETVEGSLSENGRAPTSDVAGTLDYAGGLTLDFKGKTRDYFSGRVEGTVKDSVVNARLKTRTQQACSYAFELPKDPIASRVKPAPVAFGPGLWKAHLVLVADRSRPSCSTADVVYTLDFGNDTLMGENRGARMFSVAVPEGGDIKHAFKSPNTGTNLEIIGNARTRDLEIINPGFGCRWKLTPE